MHLILAPTRTAADNTFDTIASYMASSADYDNVTVNKGVAIGYTTNTHGDYLVRAAIEDGQVNLRVRDMTNGNAERWSDVTVEQVTEITAALI